MTLRPAKCHDATTKPQILVLPSLIYAGGITTFVETQEFGRFFHALDKKQARSILQHTVSTSFESTLIILGPRIAIERRKQVNH